MGKSAGNACTELLAMYMNEFGGRNFNMSQLQEAIDVDILKEFDKCPWGYNFQYYIAALNDCHPFYVQYLLNKKALSVKSINEIVQQIPQDKKLSYDKDHIEKLYIDYQTRYCDDAEVIVLLKQDFSKKKLLLLGPGKTLQDYKETIREFIRINNPLVLSVNFLNDSYPIDYVFMGNAKRYSQFFHKIYGEDCEAKIICTSNITEAGKKIDYMVNYSGLLAKVDAIRDNPLIMLLHLLIKVEVPELWIAGFDGYDKDNSVNYYGEYVRFLYCQDNVVLRNDAIKNELNRISPQLKVSSLTPTRYI
jgi:4-hydroxy 2-oxovalerate aldolase